MITLTWWFGAGALIYVSHFNLKHAQSTQFHITKVTNYGKLHNITKPKSPAAAAIAEDSIKTIIRTRDNVNLP